jgi:hypothetical protein
MSQTKGVVFFLSTKRSGSNWVSGSLAAITRKPISWVHWQRRCFDPNDLCRKNLSYNRLELPLVSEIPLLYRTHRVLFELTQVPSEQNKLIFVTRNPKELLFREFFLKFPSLDRPDSTFVETFLQPYLSNFEFYDSWSTENRRLVFYEDFIEQEDEILLQLLHFMGEDPTYLDDFQMNKQEYMSRLLDTYRQQHTHNLGGASVMGKPNAIHYTKDVSPEVLKEIDEYIKSASPAIWEKYLQRFQ